VARSSASPFTSPKRPFIPSIRLFHVKDLPFSITLRYPFTCSPHRPSSCQPGRIRQYQVLPRAGWSTKAAPLSPLAATLTKNIGEGTKSIGEGAHLQMRLPLHARTAATLFHSIVYFIIRGHPGWGADANRDPERWPRTATWNWTTSSGTPPFASPFALQGFS
jgi:hypothetical protein